MQSHKLATKRKLLTNRRFRIRHKVKGDMDRPRLSLKLTNKHIYAQLIDDTTGKTLAMHNSTAVDGKTLPNIAGCAKLGEELGAKILKAGIKQVVFDRNGRRYHGGVKSFADGVRKAGVSF